MMSKPKRLASGTWQIRYRGPDGRQRKESFRTSHEANERLDEVRTQVRRGAYVDPADGQVRFANFARLWASGRDWKATSRESFESVLRRLEGFEVSTMTLSAIDRLVLEGVQRSLQQRYARATVELTMHYVKAIMRAAYATGRIGRDPTVGMRMPKVRAGESDGRVGPDDVPTRTEVLSILGAAPARFRAAIALGVTGLRVGEVMAVTADRLDLELGQLMIDRQLQRIGSELVFTTPKAEKVRTIRLPGAVAIELRRHLRDHQAGGLLFRGNRGATLRRDQFYLSAWQPSLVGAGFDPHRFRFHALRHFAASSMLAEGAPITSVAGHLGDTVETIQRIYAHWLRDDAEVPAMVLDRVLAEESGQSSAAL